MKFALIMNLQITILLVLVCGLIGVRATWTLNDPRNLQEFIRWNRDFKNITFGLLTTLTFLAGLYWGINDNPESTFDFLAITIGMITFILGIWISIWARLTMKSNWAPSHFGHNRNRQSKLITHGPFSFSRNPIYLGMLLYTLGFFITLRSPLIIVVLFDLVYFYSSIVREELLLKEYFGKKYEDYFKNTPRFI